MRWLPLMSVAWMASLGCGPARQPPPDPAALRQTKWPACVAAESMRRIDHCASEPLPVMPGPDGSCSPAAEVSSAPSSVELTVAPPPRVLKRHPTLAAAHDAQLAGRRDAMQRYRSARSSMSPGPDRAWAHLGLVALHARAGDFEAALSEAEAAYRLAPQASERAVVFTFARARADKRAGPWFRSLVRDAAASPASATGMLGRLTSELEALDRHDAAIAVLMDLRRAEPREACTHALRATEIAVRSRKREVIGDALATLVDDMHQDDAPRAACRDAAAPLLVRLAGDWYDRATTHHDALVVNDAAQLHDVVLNTYAQAALDQAGACVDRRQLAHRHAELLLMQGDWPACAEAYDRAWHADARGARGQRAALSALTCRQQAWLEDEARLELAGDVEKMQASIRRSYDWRTMLQSFQRYICVARDDAAHSVPMSRAAYDRAQAFFDGGALWESAIAFRMLAHTPSQGRPSRQAARRYAEIMDDLAADDGCKIALQRDLEQLDDLHCGGPLRELADSGPARTSPAPTTEPVNDETCRSIHTVWQRIRRPIL